MADNQRAKHGQPDQQGGQGDQKLQGGGAKGQGSEQTRGKVQGGQRSGQMPGDTEGGQAPQSAQRNQGKGGKR